MCEGFSIQLWAAIAPGLQSPMQWAVWSENPYVPQGGLDIDLAHIPAMARRRLGYVAKLAIFAADTALADKVADAIPVVWATRYGDADKSLNLLQSQAEQEPLSPTAFGLSVHNGVAGQHSILRGMCANAICVASSQAAPEAGVVEAMGLLHEGASEVLLVCYDAALPGAYAAFHDEPSVDFAWAVRLVTGVAGKPRFTLRAAGLEEALPAPCDQSGLPHGLDVLHFLLQPQRLQLIRSHAAGGWVWERTHA